MNLYSTKTGRLMQIRGPDFHYIKTSTVISKNDLDDLNQSLRNPVKDIKSFINKHVPARVLITDNDLDGDGGVNYVAIERLIKILENVPEKHFDLNQWYKSVNVIINKLTTHPYKKGSDYKNVVTECNTAACACGYAGLDKWFRKKGFSFDPVGYAGAISFVSNDDPSDIDTGFTAVERFFGLSDVQAKWLFLPSKGYTKPQHVIDRLKLFSATTKHLRRLALRRNGRY